MSAGPTFPERFRAEVDRRGLGAVKRRLPPRDQLPPVLAEGVDRFGGYERCCELFEEFERQRGAFFAAMVDEPTGSDFRSVHGGELLTDSRAEPDRVLLVNEHIGPARLFMQSMSELTVGRERGGFVLLNDSPGEWERGGVAVDRHAPAQQSGFGWNLIPNDSLHASLMAIACLRRSPSFFAWQPDSRQQEPGQRAFDLEFLGRPRRVSPFPAVAVRRTRCRIVFAVLRVRRPLERGMELHLREPWTAAELQDMDGPEVLAGILREAEADILDNLDCWNNWAWMRDGALL